MVDTYLHFKPVNLQKRSLKAEINFISSIVFI